MSKTADADLMGELGMTPEAEESVPEIVKPAVEAEKSVLTPLGEAIRESREALKHSCPAGMKFFESPEGFIVLAEAGQTHVWCKKANNGKGMFINPMREG